MAYQLPIKYFNSFWLKKVVGYAGLDPIAEINSGVASYQYESTVTTTAKGPATSGTNPYLIPTWPGLPWGDQLNKSVEVSAGVFHERSYPCFPFGGRDWENNTSCSTVPDCEGGSLINGSKLGGTDNSREVGRDRQWFVEEARIEGGYNNTTVDFGAKAYLVEDENFQQHRFNTLIYSGIYNSRTGINNTNLFSTAEGSITKSLDPENGSIQKLYSYNTNLTIFQENKVSKALIDKDAIYSAEGEGTPVSSLKVVIGQIVPYAGEYGISTDPQSWAQFGLRQYFVDRFRNAVLRLSRDGITEISSYGMTDYFRDVLSLVKNNATAFSLPFTYFDEGLTNNDRLIAFDVIPQDCDCDQIPIGSLLSINGQTVNGLFVVDVSASTNCFVTVSKSWNPVDFGFTIPATGTIWSLIGTVDFVSSVKDRIIGGYDTHNSNYVTSIQAFESGQCTPTIIKNGEDVNGNWVVTSSYAPTVNFDESINGWVSFYSYVPNFIDSVKNIFLSSNKRDLYKHYSYNVKRGDFYGIYNSASIQFIFNPQPSTVKNFQTISYEGSNGWQVDFIYSDPTEFDLLNGSWVSNYDQTSIVYSYDQGVYTNPNTQTITRAGFDRKENRYVTNLVNNSTIQPGEVVFGNSMSGIKAYFITVKLSTDKSNVDSAGNPLPEPTDLGGLKELYCVGAKFVKSS
mgnify:CR=1 FL=1|jgi:hypothetical protein